MSDETKRSISMLVFYLILCVGTAFSARFIAESLANNSAAGNQVYNYEEHVYRCDHMTGNSLSRYITVYLNGNKAGEYKLRYYAECTQNVNGTAITALSVIDSQRHVHYFKGPDIELLVSPYWDIRKS